LFSFPETYGSRGNKEIGGVHSWKWEKVHSEAQPKWRSIQEAEEKELHLRWCGHIVNLDLFRYVLDMIELYGTVAQKTAPMFVHF
jgi:hypothetical protein